MTLLLLLSNGNIDIQVNPGYAQDTAKKSQKNLPDKPIVLGA